jgi:hypothetical protein
LNVDFGVSGKGRLADQPFESYFLIGLGCDFRHPFRGLDDLGVQLRGGVQRVQLLAKAWVSISIEFRVSSEHLFFVDFWS